MITIKISPDQLIALKIGAELIPKSSTLNLIFQFQTSQTSMLKFLLSLFP
jgi:hypothetical protein